MMQKRTIIKYENLIKQYKKDYLSYKKGLEIRKKNHDFSIIPQYYKFSKKVQPIDDICVSMIIGFALEINDYKLALKNLKWVYLNTIPYKRPCCSNIEAAFIWYKNNKKSEAHDVLQVLFLQEPRYKNIFNNESLKGTAKEDGGFSFLNSVDREIYFERKILLKTAYADFAEWVYEDLN